MAARSRVPRVRRGRDADRSARDVAVSWGESRLIAGRSDVGSVRRDRCGPNPFAFTVGARREQFMRGRFVELLAQLVPGASLDHVECRRGTCLLDVSAATDDAAQLDGALSFIPFGDRFETESTELESGRTTIRVHVSFTREHVDAVEFETWFEHWWEERWRLARERYDRDHAAPVDGGAR